MRPENFRKALVCFADRVEFEPATIYEGPTVLEAQIEDGIVAIRAVGSPAIDGDFLCPIGRIKWIKWQDEDGSSDPVVNLEDG